MKHIYIKTDLRQCLRDAHEAQGTFPHSHTCLTPLFIIIFIYKMYIYIYVYKLWCYFCCKKTAKRKHQSHKLKLMALILQKNVLYNCWLFWEISCPYKKLSCPYKKSSCPYKKSSCPYLFGSFYVILCFNFGTKICIHDSWILFDSFW